MKRLSIFLAVLAALSLSALACIESTELTQLQPTLDSMEARLDDLDGGVSDHGARSVTEDLIGNSVWRSKLNAIHSI